MALNWTDELSVGFGRIDEQHQQLFVYYNNLLRAGREGAGRTALLPLLDFLTDYVEEHFAEEERYMALYDYPESAHHIEQHQEFSARIVALRREIEEDGPTVASVATLTHTLIHWLVSHVKRVDMKLGRFLSEQAAE